MKRIPKVCSFINTLFQSRTVAISWIFPLKVFNLSISHTANQLLTPVYAIFQRSSFYMNFRYLTKILPQELRFSKISQYQKQTNVGIYDFASMRSSHNNGDHLRRRGLCDVARISHTNNNSILIIIKQKVSSCDGCVEPITIC